MVESSTTSKDFIDYFIAGETSDLSGEIVHPQTYPHKLSTDVNNLWTTDIKLSTAPRNGGIRGQFVISLHNPSRCLTLYLTFRVRII